MKKLLVVILLAATTHAFAQEDNKGKVEVYGGYGIATAQDIISGLSNMLAGALVPGLVKRVDTDGMGAVFGGVDYYLSDRGAVGLQINYASYDQTYSTTGGSDVKIKTTYFTPMIHGKYNWLNKQYFQIYSAAAVGGSFIGAKDKDNKKDNRFTGSFQISPIGLRAGSTIAVFAEAGFGFQGIISGGISFRF